MAAFDSVQEGVFDQVYTGLWTNRLYGSVYGSTLTLNREKGGLMIAFLAIYVSATGKSFWKITRLCLHYILSSTSFPDGIYHQRQVILRNTKSASDAATELSHASFTWRNRAQHPYRRLVPISMLALGISVGFMVAGLFSSKITPIHSNEVLLTGQNCGIQSNKFDRLLNPENGLFAYSYRAQKRIEYLTYALQCYQQDSAVQIEKCQPYTKVRIPYVATRNATCPFSRDVCSMPSGNILLDTGFLDSDEYFGLNGGPHFKFRYIHHCAPLVTEGFSRVYNESRNSSIQYMRYYYGQAVPTPTYNISGDPYMYQVRMNDPMFDPEQWNITRSGTADYKTGFSWATPYSGRSFVPMPGLNRSDAMVTLLFLEASGIMYLNKTEDPLFLATKMPSKLPPDGTRFYVADRPAGVLGCATQKIFCNPLLPEQPRCVSIDQIVSGDLLSKIWADPADFAAMYSLVTTMAGIYAAYPINFYAAPGLPSLKARFTLVPPLQTEALPPNKWQEETEYTFQASLASLQSSLVEAVRGNTPLPNDILCSPQSACETLCRSLRIRSPRHYSFSVLGVALILALGGLIMIMGTFLEEIVAGVEKLRHHRGEQLTYAHLEWNSNATLHLQRLAHEALGLGTWSRTSESIPVTKAGDKLGVLDITDRMHPRLRDPESSTQFKDKFATSTEAQSSRNISDRVAEDALPLPTAQGYNNVH